MAREMGGAVREELAARYPEAVAQAPKSKAVAIRLFCRECMGGSNHDAHRCLATECWLWPHAWPGQRKRCLADAERSLP